MTNLEIGLFLKSLTMERLDNFNYHAIPYLIYTRTIVAGNSDIKKTNLLIRN